MAEKWYNLMHERGTSSEGPIISREVQGKESKFFKKYFSHRSKKFFFSNVTYE